MPNFHFQSGVSYIPYRDIHSTHYFVMHGPDSRSVCCAVDAPCDNHNPAYAQERFIAYLTWRRDNSKAHFERAQAAMEDAARNLEQDEASLRDALSRNEAR